MSEPTLQQEIEARRPATEGTLQQVAKGVPLMGRGPDGKAKIINVDENGNVKVQLSGTIGAPMERIVTVSYTGIATSIWFGANSGFSATIVPVSRRGYSDLVMCVNNQSGGTVRIRNLMITSYEGIPVSEEDPSQGNVGETIGGYVVPIPNNETLFFSMSALLDEGEATNAMLRSHYLGAAVRLDGFPGVSHGGAFVTWFGVGSDSDSASGFDGGVWS
jgi:hypothetical protein